MSKDIFVNRLRAVARIYGFQGRAGTLAQTLGECVCVVNVQKSSGRPLVAVNLGVYLVKLGIREHGDVPRKPEITDCHWRSRLHVAGGGDSWWRVDSPSTAESSAIDAGEQLERVMPELERMSGAGGLVGEWLEGRSPGLTDVQRERYLKVLGRLP